MARFTRRQFLATGLIAGGGLAIGTVLLRPGSLDQAAALVVDPDEVLLGLWIKLAPDGTATIYVPHAEMGQGVLTSLPMMLAEEMDLAWEQVRVEQAPADPAFANRDLARAYVFGGWNVPGPLVGAIDYTSVKLAELYHLQLTGGSSSVRRTGHHGMRRAGAAAREVLVAAAARRWDTDPSALRSERGEVLHPDGRRLGYGELASEAAAIDLPERPTLKDPASYQIVGTSVPRVDLPAKVDGSAVYGIDVQLPELRYAALAAIPAFGGSVKRFDAAKALALPGVEAVIEIEGGVAVVADRYWRAMKGVEALQIEFDGGPHANASSASIRAEHDAALASGSFESDRDLGDVDEALAGAATELERSYAVPYLAHATMEPMNCTAWFHDGRCEIWAGLQANLESRAYAADKAGLPFEQVTVHPLLLGGGFGRRGGAWIEYVGQAIEIAKQVPHPVKLVWTREDDIRHDAYRPATVSHLRAGLDAQGRPVAWQQDFLPKHDPADATQIPYAIPNQRVRHTDDPTHVPYGPWRSVDHTQHAFFIESFVDELAHEAGRDPLEYRLALLSDAPRHRRLLERLGEHVSWGRPLAGGRGRGVALVESFGSIVAEVVELTVQESAVRVDRVVAFADTGEVIHPDSLRGQLEGGILFGLTAALFGEITIEEGAVVQRNFPDYEMIRLATTPEIETILAPGPGPIGGAGEIGTPPIAPALANALFAATGKRVRELPLVKQGFRVAALRSDRTFA